MYKENDFIRNALDINLGKIIEINPELENIIGISKNQIEKYGKIEAIFMKYYEMPLNQYPAQVQRILVLLINWTETDSLIQIN